MFVCNLGLLFLSLTMDRTTYELWSEKFGPATGQSLTIEPEEWVVVDMADVVSFKNITVNLQAFTHIFYFPWGGSAPQTPLIVGLEDSLFCTDV